MRTISMRTQATYIGLHSEYKRNTLGWTSMWFNKNWSCDHWYSQRFQSQRHWWNARNNLRLKGSWVACLLPTTHLLCKSFRHSLEWLCWVTLAEFKIVWWMPAAEFNKTWSHNNKIQPKIAIIATLMKCRNLMLVVSISCHLPLAHTASFYVPVSSTSALDKYPDLQFITTRGRVKKQSYSHSVTPKFLKMHYITNCSTSLGYR